MSFRFRLLLTVAAVALVSLAVLAYGLRREVTLGLHADYERRVAEIVRAIEADLRREADAIGARLDALQVAISGDNRFRLAAVAAEPIERGYLLDYAGTALGVSGLAMLQILDEEGRVLSSGHFRNEHGRLAPELANRLLQYPDAVQFVTVRALDHAFLALARATRFDLGERSFTLVGGVALDADFFAGLAREREIGVSLVYPKLGGSSDPELEALIASLGDTMDGAALEALAGRVAGRLEVPVLDEDGRTPAAAQAFVLVTQSLEPLEALLARVDTWFVGTALATALVAIALAVWLSSRVSRPLSALAEKTAVLDLDRLDVDFEPRGSDEVGTLAGLLGDLTRRLRTSARHLRDAEHRAAIGQIARQVTHDIKNGLIPLRNVFRHLSQVEERDAGRLATVYRERRSTIEASIDYLETLATNYARLSPEPDRQVCDLNGIVTDLLAVAPEEEDVVVEGRLAPSLPSVVGDPVAIRRVLDNLVANAVDSLGGHGTVTVTTERVDGTDPLVRVTVADTGCGMTVEETESVFTDFYSTKPNGTGLGLSIVRRLVLDLHGSVRVSSEPGVGTRVVVEMPAGSTRAAVAAMEEGGR